MPERIDYSALDAAILECIKAGATEFSAINDGPVLLAAQALVIDEDQKPGWRFVDARLQALRKAGRLTFNRRDGWALAEGA